MVLKLSKKNIFCHFMLTSARNLSVLKQFWYIYLKVFITVFQKKICLIGVWVTVHEILPIKVAKKYWYQNQLAFAAVVYFGQAFGFCRLIIWTRTMTRSTLFSRNHLTLLSIKKRRSRVDRISQYSQENTCVEVSFE